MHIVPGRRPSEVWKLSFSLVTGEIRIFRTIRNCAFRPGGCRAGKSPFRILGSGTGLPARPARPRNRPEPVPEIVPHDAFHDDGTESARYVRRLWLGVPYRVPGEPGP